MKIFDFAVSIAKSFHALIKFWRGQVIENLLCGRVAVLLRIHLQFKEP
jgi:hypothetical protein